MDLETLTAAQALRSVIQLEPIDGPGGRLFPPTYPAADGSADKSARHVVEVLPDGSKRVLIDSVASQANRQEQALVAARAAGVLKLSDIYVDLSRTEAGIGRLSATEMPHRLSDAILRDSEVDGTAFAVSSIGQRVLAARPEDLSPLIEVSPTTLLYGVWFSQYGMPRPLKVQRAVTSEIWATGAVIGQAVGSRIDPLGIERVQLYETADGDWTANPAEASQKGGKPKTSKKRPSELNHGNIPPSIRTQGITADVVELRWSMSLAAVRRLRFGGGDRDAAGRAYIVALGLLARALDHDAGYSLRSRCELLSRGPLPLEVIDRDGAVTSSTIDTRTALALLSRAESMMTSAGLALHREVVVAPGKKLVDLISASRKVAAVGDGDDE